MNLLTTVAAGLVLISPAMLTALHGTFIPQSRVWGRNLSHGPRGTRRVALTFDDGPTPGATDRILQILQEHQVPAAFFAIGRHVAAHPELLSQVAAAGHLIGNHTFDHHHLGCFGGPRYWMDQLARADEAIARAIGRRPALFRPPMGIKSCFTARAVRRLDHTLITWSLRGCDGIATTPDQILSRVIPEVRGGDILTLHDGIDPHAHRDPQVTIATLPRLLEQIRSRGLEFAPLDELLGVEGYRS